MTPTPEEVSKRLEKIEDKFSCLREKMEDTREAQIKWIAVTDQLANSIDGLKEAIRTLRDDQKWAYRFAIGTLVGVIVEGIIIFLKV